MSLIKGTVIRVGIDEPIRDGIDKAIRAGGDEAIRAGIDEAMGDSSYDSVIDDIFPLLTTYIAYASTRTQYIEGLGHIEGSGMTNKLYTGDNLHFLNRLDSASVDLIYLDPPFNSKRTYSAPIGSKAAGSSFKDMWTWDDVDEELLATLFITQPCLVDFIKSIHGIHGTPMMAYVTYMAQRIVEMHRILKDTGSLYLHVDPTASHYLKIVLDKVFGRAHFQNEFIWYYGGGGASKKRWGRKHDVILFYSKTDRWVFNADEVRTPHKWTDGQLRADGSKRSDKGKLADDVWQHHSIMPWSKESTGYPTQKPEALLKRIILASSNKGDLVLDPFCGCATACVVAQQFHRKWIGIDIEEKAASILVERLSDDAGMFKDFIHTHDLPERTDLPIEPPTPSIRQELYEEQEGKCNGCGVQFDLRHFELDHIIPKSKGGSDTRSNYQLLCSNCNRIKGQRPMEYLRTRIALIDETLAQQITFGR